MPIFAYNRLAFGHLYCAESFGLSLLIKPPSSQAGTAAFHTISAFVLSAFVQENARLREIRFSRAGIVFVRRYVPQKTKVRMDPCILHGIDGRIGQSRTRRNNLCANPIP
uniref:Uncharacterized protein n=1 Tax=Panagrellus redivivus TaxID=6233 RepID=A0A7E4ZSZ1_PANRE